MYRLGMAMLALMLATTAVGFSLEPKIVGGTDVDTDIPRYMVGVGVTGFLFCGGSYIGDRKVVTAAHCTEGETEMVVYFSDDGSKTHFDRAIEVDVIKDFRDYNPNTMDNDISILLLSEDPPSYVQPIKLASNSLTDSIIGNGLELTAYGWGALEWEGDETPNQLQVVYLDADSMSYCRGVYGSSTITSNMICAGGTNIGKDTCQGDSGGPLVYHNGVEEILVGVTSFGDECAKDSVPGVYARVSRYVDWLNGVTLDSIKISENVVALRTGNGSFGFGLLIILLGGLLVRRR